MDAVQRMRAKAYDRKKLSTTPQQVVNVRAEQNRQVISIEPAVPDTLYVPWYEPQVVYGDLPYSASGISLLPGLSRLHRRRRDCDRSRLWRGLRARAMGARRILGRRWLLGRQPRQLAAAASMSIRPPRRALAAQSGAPRWRALQQCGPATKVRWRQSSGWRRPRGRRHRRRSWRWSDWGRGCRRQGLGTGARGANVADRARRAGGNRQAVQRAAVARNVRSGNRKLREPEISGLLPASVMVVGPGSPAAEIGQRHLRRRLSRWRRRGFRGGGGRGGGRRSDIELKHDVVLLGRLGNGLGYYRFVYNGSDKAYVGVIAQESRPYDRMRSLWSRRLSSGVLRTARIAVPTYNDWVSSGSLLPKPAGLAR